MLSPDFKAIKLSTCKSPQQALTLMARYFKEIHNENEAGFHEHAAMLVNETEVAINALQFYLNGGSVDLIKPRPIVSDPTFDISEEFLSSVADSLFEVDLSTVEIAALPPTHPFKLLRQLMHAPSSAASSSSAPPPDKTALNAQVNAMVVNLIGEVEKIDRAHFTPHPNAQVLNVTQQGVQTNIDGLIQAGFYVHKEGQQIKVDPLANAPALVEDAGRKDAREMHETMIREAKYRDILKKSFQDFAQKPNADADNLANNVRLKRPNLPDAQRPRVSVVGLGPAGAMAAIRAYQQGAIVTAIEKRSDYSRNNVFRLTPEIVDELIGLFVDNKNDIAKLSPEHPLRKLLETKALTERAPLPAPQFHAITIKDFENLTNTWLNLIARKDSNGIKLYRGYQYVPGCLKIGKKEIAITNSDAAIAPDNTKVFIPTDLLVAADGYRSNCRDDSGIVLEAMSTKEFYATFNYHPKRGTEADLYRSLLTSPGKKNIDVKKLEALGWKEARQPVTRFFNTGEHPYLGIEIPESLANQVRDLQNQSREAKKRNDNAASYRLKEQSDRLLDQWGKTALEIHLPEKDIKELVSKDAAVIEVQLMKANKSAINTDNCALFLDGDCGQTAHFQTGRGAIVGIEEANSIGHIVRRLAIQREPIDTLIAEYNEETQRRIFNLHEYAFRFPTGEDLRVKPTPAFLAFKQQMEGGGIVVPPPAIPTPGVVAPKERFGTKKPPGVAVPPPRAGAAQPPQPPASKVPVQVPVRTQATAQAGAEAIFRRKNW